MAQDPQQAPPLYTHIVSPTSHADAVQSTDRPIQQVVGLMQEMLTAQDRQNQLLEEVVSQLGASQRQRASELEQWKQANPRLARGCRQAAELLSQAQTEYLRNLTEEVADSGDGLLDGEFVLNELVDRYGPRLAHLNGVLQVLSQLSTIPNATSTND